MIFKKFKPTLSPKSFSFKDPDTGREFKGSSINDLVTQISGYRSANELETLEYLPQTIEHFLCELPIHAGQCTPAKPPHRSVVLMMRGGVNILKNILYRNVCSQEEADRRSEVCYNCPKNQFPDRSKAFTSWANQMANLSIGDRKSKYHDHLGICGICSCPMRSKVFTADKIKLSKEEIAAMKEVNCWQPEFT